MVSGSNRCPHTMHTAPHEAVVQFCADCGETYVVSYSIKDVYETGAWLEPELWAACERREASNTWVAHVVAGAVLGFNVGNLPDDSLVWIGVQALFATALLVVLVRHLKRNAPAASPGSSLPAQAGDKTLRRERFETYWRMCLFRDWVRECDGCGRRWTRKLTWVYGGGNPRPRGYCTTTCERVHR